MPTDKPPAKPPRFLTWYNCKDREMVAEGIRHDGKCHQCKEVVHLVEKSYADRLEQELDQARAMAERLAEALEKYEDTNNSGGPNAAMQALTKYAAYREFLKGRE